MFMKHTISRFFRFFLVAALVAAMAGSLLPSKALGQAAGDAAMVDVENLSTLSGPGTWTISFFTDVAIAAEVLADTTVDPQIDQSDATTITLTPSNADFDEDAGTVGDEDYVPGIPTSAVTVNGHEPDSVTTTGTTIVITPGMDVADADTVVTVVLTAGAKITHETAAAQTLGVVIVGATEQPAEGAYTTNNAPSVSVTSNDAGAVAQWRVRFVAPAELTQDNTEIGLSFSNASVPSAINKTDIAVQPADGATALLKIDPTSGGKSLSLFSPAVTIASDAQATVIISARAGIAHGGKPGRATVSVTVGAEDAMVSDDFAVNAYLSVSPKAGPRNTTVTVSGGGFTSGTSGSILVGSAAAGSYTVDSAGKLTGSFVATKGTGTVSIRDLGSGDPVDGPTFTQMASASPTATEVPRGGSVSVKLYDFPKIPDDGRLKVTASIGGTTDIAASYITGSTYTLKVPQSESPGTKQVSIMGQAQMFVIGVEDDKDDDTYTDVEDASASDSFLITIVSRTLTVSPSSAVPGQAVTVSGNGFSNINSVDLTLVGSTDPVDGGAAITVNNDGTFLYTGKVPFTEETADSGTKMWTARATGEGAAADRLAATSSGFSIQARAISLSPSTANPGSTVEVFGSGFGVTTDGNVTSEVMITVSDTNAVFGPFPISSTGEFSGAFTVPADVGVKSLTVTAKDNNGTDSSGNSLTDGFERGVNDDLGRQPVGVEDAVGADGRDLGVAGHGLHRLGHHGLRLGLPGADEPVGAELRRWERAPRAGPGDGRYR